MSNLHYVLAKDAYFVEDLQRCFQTTGVGCTVFRGLCAVSVCQDIVFADFE